MLGRKGVERSARTANIDIEPEDLLHNDLIDVVRIPSQDMRFAERSNENSTTESSDLVKLKDYFENYFDYFNELEAKITNDTQVVSIYLDESSMIVEVIGTNLRLLLFFYEKILQA